MDAILMPVIRNRANSKTAAKLNAPLLEWLSELPPSRLRAELSADSFPHTQSWGAMVRAHALDMWEDDGEAGLAWHQTITNAVDFLHQLWSENQSWAGDVPAQLSSSGFSLTFVAKQDKDVILQNIEQANKALGEQWLAQAKALGENAITPSVRLLTMEDVAREIDATASSTLVAWSSALAPTLPSDEFPMLLLASGFWLALAAAGRLTGMNSMLLGSDDLGWYAHLQWQDVEKGQGPTGEDITKLLTQTQEEKGLEG